MVNKINDVDEEFVLEKVPDPPGVVPCIDPDLIHRLTPVKGDKGTHSIGAICPSCSTSLYWYREAVPKRAQ